MKAIKDTIGLLRLKAFETDTEEGRSQERHRRIVWTTATGVVAKFAAAASLTSVIEKSVGVL